MKKFLAILVLGLLWCNMSLLSNSGAMDWEDKKFGDTYFREDLSDYQDKITFKMEINQNKIV